MTIVTPKGTAVWPKLNTPDTKFNADGEYTVKLKLSVEDSQSLIKQLEAERNTYKSHAIKKEPKVKQYADAPLYEEETDDQGDLTGFNIFKFKQKASITLRDGSSRSMSVALFDSNKTPTKAEVTGGSTIKVAFKAIGYAMPSTRMVGLSLRPSAVQIIQLAQSASAVEAVDMFDKEDGFVANNFENVEKEVEAEAVDASDF